MHPFVSVFFQKKKKKSTLRLYSSKKILSLLNYQNFHFQACIHWLEYTWERFGDKERAFKNIFFKTFSIDCPELLAHWFYLLLFWSIMPNWLSDDGGISMNRGMDVYDFMTRGKELPLNLKFTSIQEFHVLSRISLLIMSIFIQLNVVLEKEDVSYVKSV